MMEINNIGDIVIDEYSIDIPNCCENCKKLKTRKTLIHDFGRYKGIKYYDCYSPLGDFVGGDCEHFVHSNNPESVQWVFNPQLIKLTYEYIKETFDYDLGCEIDIDFLSKWEEIYELFKPYLYDNVMDTPYKGDDC